MLNCSKTKPATSAHLLFKQKSRDIWRVIDQWFVNLGRRMQQLFLENVKGSLLWSTFKLWECGLPKKERKRNKEKHTELCLGHRTCILPHADLFSKLLGSGGKNREWRQGSKGFPLLFGWKHGSSGHSRKWPSLSPLADSPCKVAGRHAQRCCSKSPGAGRGKSRSLRSENDTVGIPINNQVMTRVTLSPCST